MNKAALISIAIFSVFIANAMQNDYRMMGTYSEHSTQDGVTAFSCPESSSECYRGPGNGPPEAGHVVYLNDNGTRVKATLVSVHNDTSDPSGSENNNTYQVVKIEE